MNIWKKLFGGKEPANPESPPSTDAPIEPDAPLESDAEAESDSDYSVSNQTRAYAVEKGIHLDESMESKMMDINRAIDNYISNLETIIDGGGCTELSGTQLLYVRVAHASKSANEIDAESEALLASWKKEEDILTLIRPLFVQGLAGLNEFHANE